MPISRADVEHVARLARLALTDEELDRFHPSLSGQATLSALTWEASWWGS